MWEISSSSQYTCFIYSMILGVELGLIYDFFKIDRIVFKRKSFFVFLQDILFWLIAAFEFFSFSVVFSNGQIRGYLLLGSILGFFIYRLTFSKIINLIIIPLKRLKNILKKFYLNFINKIVYYTENITNKVKIFIKKFLTSKNEKNIKNNLKNS